MPKYDPPAGPPPGYTISEPPSTINTPQPAHIQPTGGYASENPNHSNNPYQTPQNNGGFNPQGGYYAPGPQMGYAQQGPPPQGGYYGPQGPGPYGPGPQGGYGGYGYPQGQYVDRRDQGGSGFTEALLASLACCCCLDACLLF